MRRANWNKTITVTEDEKPTLQSQIRKAPKKHLTLEDVTNVLIEGDMTKVCSYLPRNFVDVAIIDPPYNLTKKFTEKRFTKKVEDHYSELLTVWIDAILPLLKKTATVYVCNEWSASAAVQRVLSEVFFVRNRITFERDKGRGSSNNWKNISEDIWFCTVGSKYTFNIDAVKQRKKVRAAYTESDGTARDWQRDSVGKYRLTHPSNVWTDITIPFWSMPENTNHPTQKPEKLIAKLLLASSNKNNVIFDPFGGSGTTSVVAKKLGRKFVSIEKEKEFCLVAQKRINSCHVGDPIQGYENGVFVDRISS